MNAERGENAIVAAQGLHVFVARSKDGGLTYPDVAVVARGPGAGGGVFPYGASGAAWHSEPKIVSATDGTALFAWSHIVAAPARSEVLWATSRDGFAWSNPKPIAIVDGVARVGWPTIDAHGGWHVPYATIATVPPPPATRLVIASSNDEGSTWESTTLPDPYPMQTATLRTVLNAEGSLRFLLAPVKNQPGCMAMPLVRTCPQLPLLSMSKDGKAWSTPLVLDTDARGVGGPLLAMDVAVDQTVFASFFHFEDENRAQRRFVAIRNETISQPIILEDNIPGQAVRGGNLGEYLGLTALPEGAFTSWITSAGSDQDLTGARVHSTGST